MWLPYRDQYIYAGFIFMFQHFTQDFTPKTVTGLKIQLNECVAHLIYN